MPTTRRYHPVQTALLDARRDADQAAITAAEDALLNWVETKLPYIPNFNRFELWPKMAASPRHRPALVAACLRLDAYHPTFPQPPDEPDEEPAWEDFPTFDHHDPGFEGMREEEEVRASIANGYGCDICGMLTHLPEQCPNEEN